ncbi:MAG: valine--tRNA ligase [Qipengyuania sp.]|nr:valine--tRNA ligase [Qipengyuania sp.]
MTQTISKTFDPAAIEAKWYAHWEESGAFRPERPDAEPFTIVNPPPNVTGSLHIGHALDNTLQDVIVRYERLRGKDALWVVGTDHAGIATQMVVERNLNSQGLKRTDMPREAFVEHVWEWKEQSGGAITRQLRRLGCSMDWSREQFTMDPHFSAAVTKVFVDLYNQGLIYRAKRLVNWDPALKTAISDLEVESREVQGGFWHFKYPLADGVKLDNGADYILVATTRPETMLADMAVAVHPTDERYRSVVGKEVVLPITGRRVPVIADEHADPELGSGAVKITPGHDFNDFEVGKRAGIAPSDMLNMFDAEAKVCQIFDEQFDHTTAGQIDEGTGLELGPEIVLVPTIPEDLIGLDRFDARARVVAMLKESGHLIPHITEKDGERIEHDAEPRVIATPFGDRGGVVIEPWLTDQWYVDAEKLAQAPIEAVRSGEIEIVPKSWEKTFFNWMENIQPWCVSRQLWWGHRIPAWYGLRKNGDTEPGYKVFVAEDFGGAVEQARKYYPEGTIINEADDGETIDSNANVFAQFTPFQHVNIKRDEDVLDTWFSSALWPFATLGWPEQAPPVGPAGQLRFQGRGPSREAAGGVGAVADDGAQHLPHPNPSPEGEGLLAKHYPNDLLISGFDILFFWDARMMMMGRQLTGQNPWKRLYLHGLVRAADGQKMSKSKGNVVDPLGLIDKYGADALRFFMAAMESQGRDVKMDEKRVEGYRNFATKLWNAARFCQANGIGASQSIAAPEATSAVNKWIVGEVVQTVEALDKAFAELRFDVAASAIYRFVWDRFCDWYLELIKPVLSQKPSPLQGRGLGEGESSDVSDSPLPPTPSPEGEGEIDETRAVAGWVLDQILVMLHPFMPFVTEELWHGQGARPYDLILAKWPEPEAALEAQAKADVDWLIRLVGGIRATRSELNVPPSARLALHVVELGPDVGLRVSQSSEMLRRLARVTPTSGPFEGAAAFVVADGATYALPLEGVIDVAAEKARLGKALEASRKEAKSLEGRLSNAAFVEKARPEAVEKARADRAHHAAEAARLEAALARLG